MQALRIVEARVGSNLTRPSLYLHKQTRKISFVVRPKDSFVSPKYDEVHSLIVLLCSRTSHRNVTDQVYMLKTLYQCTAKVLYLPCLTSLTHGLVSRGQRGSPPASSLLDHLSPSQPYNERVQKRLQQSRR